MKCAIASLVAVLVVNTLQSGDLTNDLDELKRLRLKTAERVYHDVRLAFEAKTVSLDLLLKMTCELVEAQRSIAKSPKEELAILNANVKRHKELFAKLCPPGYPPERRQGERNEYPELQLEIQKAEIAVLEYRIKSKL